MTTKTKKRIGIAALALGMIVGVGATAGTTLAKYVSSTSIESNSATVAAWGFTLSVDSSALFGNQYQKGAIVSNRLENGDGTIDVQSATADANVVAPGTSGSLGVTVNGTAEVMAQLTYSVKADNFSVPYLQVGDDDYYYPIAWSVGDTEVLGAGIYQLAPADYYAALVLAINTEYAANYNALIYPSNTAIEAKTNVLSWDWALDQGYNTYDTVLGQIAADKGAPWNLAAGIPEGAVWCIGVSVDFTATIQQVQVNG